MAELKQYAAEPMAEVPEMKELIDKKIKEMAELKPCDCKCTSIIFNECGYTNTKQKLYYYSCPYCGKVSEPQTSKKKAIDAWNKRS